MRQIFIYLIIFAIAFLVWWWTVYPDQNLHLVFCDVGQGDAILIQQGFKQLLIDTGPDDQVLACLEHFMPRWDRELELVLLTHDDFDHIGGLETVISSYKIQQIISDKSDKIEKQLLKDKNKQNNQLLVEQLIQPFFGTKIYFSESFWGEIISHFEPQKLVLAAQKHQQTETSLWDADLQNTQTEKEANDRSIVILWHAEKQQILLMGDLGEKGELALIANNLITKTNLLKVGHHGSKTSTSWQFLSITQPEISVISVGEDNNFGHPDSATLDNLARIGAKVFRTDESGSLEFITNGEVWW